MKIKIIFWDFDGVIISSLKIREMGFRAVLKNYPKNKIESLIKYHRENSGWSRYVKFEYFFKKIRKERFTKNDILKLAKSYSNSVKSDLIDKSLLIEESMNFIKEKYQKYIMYIVSGSDGKELNEVCKGLEISNYFHSIYGSPEPKKDILKRVLKQFDYEPSNCLMIGDARNDYDAAIENRIPFLGFNSPKVEELSTVKFDLSKL